MRKDRSRPHKVMARAAHLIALLLAWPEASRAYRLAPLPIRTWWGKHGIGGARGSRGLWQQSALNALGLRRKPLVVVHSASAVPDEEADNVDMMEELQYLEGQVIKKFDAAMKEGREGLEATKKGFDDGLKELEKEIKVGLDNLNKVVTFEKKDDLDAAIDVSGQTDYGMVRFGEILNQWSTGQLSTIEFGKAASARLNSKVQEAISMVTPKSQVDVVVDQATGQYMEGGWARRGKGSAFFRTLEIWGNALSFVFKELKIRKIKDVALQKEERRLAARYARDCLLRLGPTFIKFGQLLSTRIDILPKEYTEEFSLLQDNVPGFSGDVAKRVILEDLGKPVEELFDWFDVNPIAAASLGQVHRARYKGAELAVKVQRQGLKKLFDLDLKNLKVLAVLLDKFDPKSDGAARDWKSIYEESARLLYKEIDYVNEGRNANRFAENWRGVPWVKVPDIYWNFTSTRVLTMEYCPGIKISDIPRIEAAGIDRGVLAKRSAESYLTQLCRHGFYHCDCHPGNIAVDGVDGGRLVYYDFGMMDELGDEVKRGLVDLIFSVYENDPKGVCDAMERMGILRRGADRVSVEKIARYFLTEFTSTLANRGKWVNELDKGEQKKIAKIRRAQLGEDLLSVSTDLPFRFPPSFTFVFRAFTSLDGIGKGLDSGYDLTKLAQPFLRELIDIRDGSAAVSVIKSWQKKLGWRPEDIAALVTSPRKVARIDDTLTRAERGELKLRVRVLESERAFKRMDIAQAAMANAVLASMFLNLGILVTSMNPQPALAARTLPFAARGLFATAALFGVQVPVSYFKLRQFDKKSQELGLARRA